MVSINTTTLQISIHAPLTGSDSLYIAAVDTKLYFNPRSPYGERLSSLAGCQPLLLISIHAPLTGSDV